MIAILLAAAFLTSSLFVGWKLDSLARAFERYSDRAFGVEESVRRLERAINLAASKSSTRAKK